MVKELTYSITGVGAGDLEAVTVREAYNSPSAGCVITVYDTTLGLGDSVSVSLGYGGSNTKVFQGLVQQIEHHKIHEGDHYYIEGFTSRKIEDSKCVFVRRTIHKIKSSCGIVFNPTNGQTFNFPL